MNLDGGELADGRLPGSGSVTILVVVLVVLEPPSLAPLLSGEAVVRLFAIRVPVRRRRRASLGGGRRSSSPERESTPQQAQAERASDDSQSPVREFSSRYLTPGTRSLQQAPALARCDGGRSSMSSDLLPDRAQSTRQPLPLRQIEGAALTQRLAMRILCCPARLHPSAWARRRRRRTGRRPRLRRQQRQSRSRW